MDIMLVRCFCYHYTGDGTKKDLQSQDELNKQITQEITMS